MTGENEAFSRTSGGVEEAHAVRADHPHPVAANLLDQSLLQRAAGVADFRKPCGDDDERFHAGGRAVVDDLEHRGRGTAMTARSIPAGSSRDRRIAGQAVDLVALGIDRIDRPL